MENPDFEMFLPEHELSIEIFTAYHHIRGKIKTLAYRTNGVLNATEDYLLLDDVSTGNLLRPQDAGISSRFSRIFKSAIVFAVPNDEPETERLLKASKVYSRGELLQRRVLIGLGNFEVSGDLHLSQELELDTLLLDRPEQFIGVTDASIVFLPNPGLKFTADAVLINKDKVDFICAGAP